MRWGYPLPSDLTGQWLIWSDWVKVGRPILYAINNVLRGHKTKTYRVAEGKKKMAITCEGVQHRTWLKPRLKPTSHMKHLSACLIAPSFKYNLRASFTPSNIVKGFKQIHLFYVIPLNQRLVPFGNSHWISMLSSATQILILPLLVTVLVILNVQTWSEISRIYCSHFRLSMGK